MEELDPLDLINAFGIVTTIEIVGSIFKTAKLKINSIITKILYFNDLDFQPNCMICQRVPIWYTPIKSSFMSLKSRSLNYYLSPTLP